MIVEAGLQSTFNMPKEKELADELSLSLKDVDADDDVDVDKDRDEEDRDHGTWSSQMDFFLSMVGYCVGLGNLWRFPYFCNRNGGGAFLIPYFIFLVTVGLPLFFMEISLGQFSGKGALHVWSICPLFKGLGYCMNIASVICAFYFNLIIAWVLYYFVMSFAKTLPWVTCDNWWNTPICTSFQSFSQSENSTLNGTQIWMIDNVTSEENVPYTQFSATDNVTVIVSNDTRSAVEEFWQYNTLRVSSGLNDMGELQWHLVASLFVAWFLIFLCLIKGVKSVGKVVYVTATLPYLLITCILIRAVTLEGAREGIIYYIKPDFKKLIEPQVWLEAMLQMFYSLGVTWGGLHTMASYNKFSNNCYRDAVILTFLSEGTSFYAGFAIFSVLGFMANNIGVPVSEVIRAGPGLGFVAYPEALAQLPLPQLWSVLFFVMLLTIGLDSEFAMLETILTAVLDTFPKQLHKRRMILTAVTCILYFLVGLVFATQGAIYVFVLIDWYVSTFCLQLVGILECVAIGWIYGANRFSSDIEVMLGRKPPVYMKPLWCFVAPGFMIICLVFTILQYEAPTYGDYEFPAYGVLIGWCIAMVSLIPLPVCALKELWNAEGSFLERLRKSLRPDPSWGPRPSKYRLEYSASTVKTSWKDPFLFYKW